MGLHIGYKCKCQQNLVFIVNGVLRRFRLSAAARALPG